MEFNDLPDDIIFSFLMNPNLTAKDFCNFIEASPRAKQIYREIMASDELAEEFIKTHFNVFDNKTIFGYNWKNTSMFEGPYISYDKHNKIAEQGEYVCGRREGKWLIRGPLDSIDIVNYENGRINDIKETYNKDDILISTSYYKNGVLNGEFINYSTNGTIIARGNYVNGIRDGEYLTFYDSGELKNRFTYIDGKINGFYEVFYQNGKPKTIANYVMGKLNGKYQKYCETGHIKEEGIYINALKDGLWKYYNCIDGTLEYDETYTLDIKNGLTRQYYPNGIVKSEGMYVNNQKDGVWQYYDKMGDIEKRVAYDKNIWIYIDNFYPNGYIKSREESIPNSPDLIYTEYYDDPNGVVSKYGEIYNNEPIGIWYIYNTSGDVIDIIDYGNYIENYDYDLGKGLDGSVKDYNKEIV